MTELSADVPSADVLSSEVMAALRQPPGAATAILATVDADGSPRTAAFGSVRPISPTQLRFGCDRTHDTFANLVRDGRVMVAFLAPPAVAVGIRGRAWVVREQIEVWPTDAVIEIEVEAVKDDLLPGAPIVGGITYDLSNELAVRVQAYIDEVEAAM